MFHATQFRASLSCPVAVATTLPSTTKLTAVGSDPGAGWPVGVVAAAHQEVDIVASDGEGGRGHRALDYRGPGRRCQFGAEYPLTGAVTDGDGFWPCMVSRR